MEWIRAHPYVASLIGAAIFLLAGIFIVANRTALNTETPSVIAWGGSGTGFFSPTAGINPQNTSGRIYEAVQESPPFTFVPPTPTSEQEGETNFDFEGFLALISQDESGAGAAPNGSFVSDAYSFIPSGLIANTETKSRTASQEALYFYGNDAGLYIQVFEDRNRDMARVLKDQFEDPGNTQKRARLVGLGEDMKEVGDSLLELENVPAQVKTANERLAQSYQNMGEVLALVPNAETDEEKIAAMLAYNATVEEFIQRYVALATLFPASGVTFRPEEPGSVFVFTPTPAF